MLFIYFIEFLVSTFIFYLSIKSVINVLQIDFKFSELATMIALADVAFNSLFVSIFGFIYYL